MSGNIFCVCSEADKLQYNLEDVGWYFWDETGAAHGPFNTDSEAQLLLNQYVAEVLG